MQELKPRNTNKEYSQKRTAAFLHTLKNITSTKYEQLINEQNSHTQSIVLVALYTISSKYQPLTLAGSNVLLQAFL